MLFNLLLMYFEDLSGTGFLRSSPTKNRVYGTSVLNPPPPFPSNERPKPTAVKTLHWVKLVNPRQQCVCSITHRALFVLPFVSMSLFISLCATVFVFRLCIDWFYVWVGSPLIGLPGRQAMCVVQHRTTHTCYPI
jgi:hypothetical protein